MSWTNMYVLQIMYYIGFHILYTHAHIPSCQHCGSGSNYTITFANYAITYQIGIKNTKCEIYSSAVPLIIKNQTNKKNWWMDTCLLLFWMKRNEMAMIQRYFYFHFTSFHFFLYNNFSIFIFVSKRFVPQTINIL